MSLVLPKLKARQVFENEKKSDTVRMGLEPVFSNYLIKSAIAICLKARSHLLSYVDYLQTKYLMISLNTYLVKVCAI
jgi:hypothetical protein